MQEFGACESGKKSLKVKKLLFNLQGYPVDSKLGNKNYSKISQYSSVRYTTLASGDFSLVFPAVFKTRTFTPAGMTTSF